jgi:excisionase family DNA binding protein
VTDSSTPDHGTAEQHGPAKARILHTPAEAATMLAVKESWLRRQAGLRRIPSTMLGKHLRFSATDLAEIVRHGHRVSRAARRSANATRRGTARHG